MSAQSAVPAVRAAANETFDEFFATEYPRVLALLFALAGSRTAAEDVAQEAFLRAYLRWGQVAAMDRPQAWVRRVAINLATSRGRRLAAEARALVRIGGREESVEMPTEDADFWRAVRTLPTRQAQAVALHYVDDLTIDDAALVMNCAAGTVKAHLHAARKRLETLLQVTEESP